MAGEGQQGGGGRAQEADEFGFGARNSGKPLSFSLASDMIGFMFQKNPCAVGERVGRPGKSRKNTSQVGEGGGGQGR